MKVAITGHTRGIGFALAEKFKANNYKVVGFSASTGCNIDDFNVRQNIIEQILDCDIFVNNAYHPIGQTDLLKQVTNKWEGTDKTIINISSKFVFQKDDYARFREYTTAKKEQNKFIEDRMTVNSPRILNVLPGIVDTDMSSMFQATKTDPSEIANLIFDMLKYKTLTVQQLIIDVPGLDWKDIKLV